MWIELHYRFDSINFYHTYIKIWSNLSLHIFYNNAILNREFRYANVPTYLNIKTITHTPLLAITNLTSFSTFIYKKRFLLFKTHIINEILISSCLI